MTYIETSAIKTSNIKEAFVGLVRPKLSATSSTSTWPTNSDSLPLSWKPRAVSRKVFFWREIRRSEKIFHESSWRKKTKKNFFVICVISVLFVVTFMFGLKLVFLGQKGGQAWWSITEPCKTVYDCHGIKFKLYHNHQNSSAYLTITVSLGMLTADCSADWSMLGQCCSRSVLNLLFNILPGEVWS